MREIDVLKTKQEPSQQAGTLFGLGKEHLFTGVRPRLLRLARLRGVAPDALEDVVQETLLLAWRLLDRLNTTEHFSLWLEEICRNVCARHRRASHRDTARHIPLLSLPLSDESDAVENRLL